MKKKASAAETLFIDSMIFICIKHAIFFGLLRFLVRFFFGKSEERK
jgi:hypothetical protein